GQKGTAIRRRTVAPPPRAGEGDHAKHGGGGEHHLPPPARFARHLPRERRRNRSAPSPRSSWRARTHRSAGAVCLSGSAAWPSLSSSRGGLLYGLPDDPAVSTAISGPGGGALAALRRDRPRGRK